VTTQDNLMSVIRSTCKWSFSITAKFIRVVPGYTSAIIFSTVVSQLALILAFFLPLKVIILLGAASIPSYFPPSWQMLDRGHLIITLAISAAGFYLLYLLTERLITYLSMKGATRLLEKSKKINLFNNQDDIAVRAYLRYSRSLAGIVFFLIALNLIGFLYPSLTLVIIGYMLTVFLLLLFGYGLSQRVRNGLEKNINGIGATIGAIGFLFAFGYIVWDFLSPPAPGVIVAIISLLLVRQMINRLVSWITDLSALYIQRLQINALFFRGHTLLNDRFSRELDFWSLFETHRRDEWVNSVLTETAQCNVATLDYVWHQTGISGVVAFEVIAKGSYGQNVGKYLIKLYDKKFSNLAKHEASLLVDPMADNLPTINFVGADMVGEYHCSIFESLGEQKIFPSEIKKNSLIILKRLLSIEVSGEVIEKYTRSRPTLAHRLSNNMLNRLHLITEISPGNEQFSVFCEKFGWITSKLAGLPIQLVNLDINPGSLSLDVNGEPVLSHWGKWGVEPVGAGWPIRKDQLCKIEEALIEAQYLRPELLSVTAMDVKLSALMFSFESMYNRQKYSNVLDLLPRILECIDIVGTPLNEGNVVC